MRNILFIGCIALLGITAVYFFVGRDTAPPVDEPVTDMSVTGTITNIDRSQMTFDGPVLVSLVDADKISYIVAVPSMGMEQCGAKAQLADLAQAAVGDTVSVRGSVDENDYIVPCAETAHYLTLMGMASDAAFGYEFTYRKGPEGYIVLEDSPSADADYVTGVILFNAAEYEAFAESTEPRDGPPAMQLRVYTNPENLEAPTWAERHPQESNIELASGEAKEAMVGGVNAVHYIADGLYPLSTYVVAHGEHVYILSGAYSEPNDQLAKDFSSLVETFTFIQNEPVATPQAKIDPREACENALGYMTFETGEAAEAFVTECIAGEHPEVIDRYIEELGLQKAAI